MSEKLGSAVLELSTDDRALDKGIDRAESKSEQLAASFERKGKRARAVGGKLSLAVTAPIIAMAATSVNAHRQQAKAIAGVEANLASMGNVAGFTSQQLQGIASDLQANSLFGDEQILKEATSNLLTFGNIADQQFTRAQQVSLDLAAQMGGDLQGKAIMVGKALNDPASGLTMLTRVGITFTDQQKEQIKAMQQAGDVAGAQGLILNELERQFSGQAAAAAEADGGVIQLKNTWGDIQEEWGAVIAEVLPTLVGGMGDLAAWLRSLDDDTKRWVLGIAGIAAVAGPVLVVFGMMASGIGGLLTLFPLLMTTVGLLGKALLFLAANPVFLVIGAAVAAIYFAWQNWDKIQPIIDAVGNAISAWWNDTVQPVLEAISPVVKKIVDIFQQYFGDQLSAVVDGVTALMNGDFKAVWANAVKFVTAPVRAIMGVVNSLVPGITNSMRALYEGVQTWLGQKLASVFKLVSDKIQIVADKFQWLWDVVVGNSYVPDLVKDVSEWFDKLDAGMVQPTEKATKDTAELFRKMAEDIQPLMDRLFPDVARFRQYQAELAKINAMADVMGAEVAEEARGRLSKEYLDEKYGKPEVSVADQGPLPELPSAKPIVAGIGDEIGGAAGDTMQDAVARRFSDGILAALDGDLGGFFSNWFDQILVGLADNLGSLLSDVFSDLFSGEGGLGDLFGALFGSQDPGSGGGIGGLLSGIFAGGFYTGGKIPTGQFGIVGERGPEPVFATPGGIGVGTNSSLNSSAFQPAAPNISMPISIDATGADAAALARVKDSVDTLKRDIPNQVLNTVQDAGERGMLRTGNWR